MTHSISGNYFLVGKIKKTIFYLIICLSSIGYVEAKVYKPLNAEIAKKNLNHACVMAFATALKSGDDEKAASFCDEALMKDVKENHFSLKSYREMYFRDMDMSTLVYRASPSKKNDHYVLKYVLKFSNLEGKKSTITLYVDTKDGKKILTTK